MVGSWICNDDEYFVCVWGLLKFFGLCVEVVWNYSEKILRMILWVKMGEWFWMKLIVFLYLLLINFWKSEEILC